MIDMCRKLVSNHPHYQFSSFPVAMAIVIVMETAIIIATRVVLGHLFHKCPGYWNRTDYINLILVHSAIVPAPE